MAFNAELVNVDSDELFEAEKRLDAQIRIYVETMPGYALVNEPGEIGESARTKLILAAYAELDSPVAFAKAVRVIFSTCPDGLAANAADLIIRANIPGDYGRDKYRGWYGEHKTL